MKSFLLWQQTFPVNKALSFHVLPFDKDVQSWVLAVFTGGLRQPPRLPQPAGQWASLSEASGTTAFSRVTSTQVFTRMNIEEGSKEKRIVAYTDTFHLHYVKTKSDGRDTGNSSAFVLTAHPLDYQEATQHVRGFLSNVRLFDNKTGGFPQSEHGPCWMLALQVEAPPGPLLCPR